MHAPPEAVAARNSPGAHVTHAPPSADAKEPTGQGSHVDPGAPSLTSPLAHATHAAPELVKPRGHAAAPPDFAAMHWWLMGGDTDFL